MSTVEVKVRLPDSTYKQLDDLARQQHRTLDEVLQTAVSEWLEAQVRLEQARALMRELGQGLEGSGHRARDVARRHDAYLYKRDTR